MKGFNHYRYFHSDRKIREVAFELYSTVADLPILSPHGHTDPAWFAENKPFDNPTALLIQPDHYIFRMLYSQGIGLESLGIPDARNRRSAVDPRAVWQIFAEHFYLFAGTPTGIWMNHVFQEVFEIESKFDGGSADDFYETIAAALQTDDFLPRSLLKRFNIECIATTDEADARLDHHQTIKDSDLSARVIPTFRPDAVTNLLNPDWGSAVARLGEAHGSVLASLGDFISALEERRRKFKEMGATATDHGVLSPFTIDLAPQEADKIYQRALRGEATAEDTLLFSGYMLMEMARMSIEDGLVMQIHPGSYRNHNATLFEGYGPDMGADIPMQTEYTRNLKALLNTYGNDPRLTLIVFTLDESTYSRELAPLAGHYPAMKLGPAWWFHDSPEGMRRYRKMTTETASIYNTVGFNDDTRALLSIPARHDLSRRIDSNYIAELVVSQQIDMDDARRMSSALAYDLAKTAYKL